MLAHFCVHLGVFWLPGGEAVDVAVVHAEGGGDEHGVVDLEVGCAEVAGGLEVSSELSSLEARKIFRASKLADRDSSALLDGGVTSFLCHSYS